MPIRGSSRLTLAAAAFAVTVATGSAAKADVLLSSWTWNSSGLAGEADFYLDNNNLKVVLTNQATSGPGASNQILSGLFFNIVPSSGSVGALTMVSAIGNLASPSGTSITLGATGANICAPGSGGTAPSSGCGSTVGGGWEAGYYANGANTTNSLASSQHYGLGTSGLGGLFNGNGSTGTGQINYGIIPSVGLSSSANSGVTGTSPYVDDSAVFELTGLPTGITFTIANVAGAYGTAPEALPAGTTNAPTPAPEPASLALIGSGLVALSFTRKKRS